LRLQMLEVNNLLLYHIEKFFLVYTLGAVGD
jgi:hypothetical protein